MFHNSPKKILFVCTGNICRSPLAHAVLEQMMKEKAKNNGFILESAGTHSYHVGENADGRMRQTAAKHGYSFTHHANHVSRNDLSYYDLILAMDHGHYSHLKRMCRNSDEEKKIRMYREFDPQGTDHDEVPDPYYGGQSGFENVFDIVKRTSENLMELLGIN